MSVLVALASLSACVLLAEFTLHHLGHRPGIFLNYDNFSPTDSLRTYALYTNDEVGIYRLGTYVTDTLAQKHGNSSAPLPGRVFADDLMITEGVDVVLRDLHTLLERIDSISSHGNPDDCIAVGEGSEFALSACLSMVSEDEDAEMFRSYLSNPFNSEGFRGVDLSTDPRDTLKVMLIGDSFVWGMSAEPVYNSFSDILLARGLNVYNFGIPGTDPAQYEAIVRKYVPIVNPDVVVVCVFPGNDLIPFIREVASGRPMEHLTNFGFLDSHPTGEYFSPRESYDFYIDINRIPEAGKNGFNWFFSQSNVLTKLWLLLYELHLVDHDKRRAYDRMHRIPDIEKARTVSAHLKHIREICSLSGTEVLFTVIPDKQFTISRQREFKETQGQRDLNRVLFNQGQYYYPDGYTLEDFESGGVHFNNSGSLKYADFLESVIRDRIIPEPNPAP